MIVKIVSIETISYFSINHKKTINYMLIIPVKEGENIDRALKRYKRKTRNTKLLNNLRERKQFTKKSVSRRKQVEKAAYKQHLQDQEDK
jgi:small subunit ribosomal protein S21